MFIFYCYSLDQENVVDQNPLAIENVVHVLILVIVIERKIHANVHVRVLIPKVVIIMAQLVEKIQNHDINSPPKKLPSSLMLFYIYVYTLSDKDESINNRMIIEFCL
jgi:hypothetical protein